MTKISKKSAYPVKVPIKKDYFIGTDSEDNLRTVNFDFETTAGLINSINGTSIINYLYDTSPYISTEVLVEGKFLSLGAETNTSALTKLYVNKFNHYGDNLSELYLFLKDNATDFLMKIRNSNNQNNAVYFDISSIEDFSDYFIFNISVFKENEFLPLLENMNVYFFDFALKATGNIDPDPTKEDTANKSTSVTTDGASDVKYSNVKSVKTYVDASISSEALDRIDEDTLLDSRITVLENIQDLNTNFTGQAYAVWSGTGLVYDVIYPDYYIEGVLYAGATEQITLDVADPTDPRQDMIVVDATGAIKKTGIASPDPAAPSIDSQTEIYITTVLVGAGATTPTGVSNEDIYKENTEWTTSSDIATINFNATSSPFEGAKHIETGAFTAGKYVLFVDGVTHNCTNYDTIRLRIYLKATFTNSTKFLFYFFNGGTAVSQLLTLNSGQYGFSRTVINQWQDIVIPISAFTFQSSLFDTFEIITAGSNASGFKIDNIILNTGVGGVNPLQKSIISIVTDSGVANATIANDSITFSTVGGLAISAVGKIITFTNLFTAALKTNYDSAYTWVSTNGATVLAHLSRTDNPHSVTASQVGLGNVDNTSDANKPVSTAQLTALNAKQNQLTAGTNITIDVTNPLAPIISASGGGAVDSVNGQTGVVVLDTGDIAEVTDKNYVSDAELVVIGNTSGTNSGNETATTIATINHAATVKTVLVDADEVTGQNSATSFSLIRTVWSDVWTYIKGKIQIDRSYACSDETSNLTVGQLISFRMAYAMTATEVRISLVTAPTLNSVIVNITVNGVSMFSTLLSIDASEKTSVTAAVPAVILNPSIPDDAEIIISTTQIGSGNAGKGLKTTFIGVKA